VDDVSKCLNRDCTTRGKCWRFITPAYKRQLYAHFKQEESGACKHFVPLRRDMAKAEG
jgi:hypothetical protein